MSKISCPVKKAIWLNMVAILIFSPVYISGYARKACQKIHGIIKSSIPIFFFIHARCISFRELAFCLKRHNSYHKLRHWMGANGQSFYGSKYMIGNMAPSLPNRCNMLCIFIIWQLSNQHQVKEAFRQRL